jgi:heme O synthase-like polyprenyltransferase
VVVVTEEISSAMFLGVATVQLLYRDVQFHLSCRTLFTVQIYAHVYMLHLKQQQYNIL